jgi:hypothetical protein
MRLSLVLQLSRVIVDKFLSMPIQKNFMENISYNLCCMWSWNINEPTKLSIVRTK